jgi:prevent-host-death family protein
MGEAGLRELRQAASDLVRRAEAGETIVITVSGRPAATLGPVAPQTWRTWDEVGDLFDLPSDTGWSDDLDRIDGTIRSPWGEE